jgi:protein-tyrosine phosphatase
MIDIHAHVLPGLDDGPANMGDAIALVRAAVDDHITTIVASPHMLDGVYNATRDDIFAGVADMNDALREHGIAVPVLVGADIHAEADVASRLRNGELVTVADLGKYLMLELPPDVVPRELDQLLFDVQLQGVRPVLSHPERNRAIQEDVSELIPMVEAGCLVQVTAASILGDFGSQIRECTESLFGCRLVHLVATDMHGVRRRRPRLSDAAAAVKELVGVEEAHEILERNPEALIHGAPISAPDPELPRPHKRWFFW